MRVLLATSVVMLVAAGCSSKPTNPVTDQTLRSAMQAEGFHVVWTFRLTSATDADLKRLAHYTFGGLKDWQRLVPGIVAQQKHLRTQGLREYVIGERRQATVDAEVWTTSAEAAQRAKLAISQDTQAIPAAGIPSRSLRQIGLVVVHRRNVVLEWSTYKTSKDFQAHASSLAKRVSAG